jgi:hypothetical protein
MQVTYNDDDPGKQFSENSTASERASSKYEIAKFLNGKVRRVNMLFFAFTFFPL